MILLHTNTHLRREIGVLSPQETREHFELGQRKILVVPNHHDQQSADSSGT